jgi:2-keto-4-pentenoate hydratase/2-oxohepta-3-ene-1,7-dioic acid hydratase in catechol pathway
VLLDGNRAVDVSADVDDFGPSFFAAGGLDRLRGIVAKRHQTVDVAGRRFGPPIARPYKLIGIGLNYTDHVQETGGQMPEEPVVFMKATNSIIGPNDDVILPPGATKLDWEVELAIVIAGTARYLRDESEALQAIAGFCIANDISERSFQLERGGQWVKGKSAETFCPIGPWLVTKDEVGDLDNVELRLSVNGELMQQGSTRTMIFSPSHLVWYVSQFMVLEPGDLILTGTPSGVGLTRGTYLREGDAMELSITGLGMQRQRVASRTRTPPTRSADRRDRTSQSS